MSDTWESYGCIDTLYFKTSDGASFGCNARTGTAYTNNLTVLIGPNPKVITFSGELAEIWLFARSNCMLGFIRVHYNSEPRCASNNVTAITLDMANVNGKT